MAQVITLLEDLKAEVEGEGTAEETSYQEFAEFCQSKTSAKSESIISGKNTINQLSADIEQDTTTKEVKVSEHQAELKKKEELEAELDATTARCAKEKEVHDAEDADLAAAISGLKGAITSLGSAKPALAQVSAALSAVQSGVHQHPLAAALAKAQRSALALLQVDPVDPMYKYHSQGILDTLNSVLELYEDKKAKLNADFAKAEQICVDEKATLNSKIQLSGETIDTLETDISGLKVKIAQDRQTLVDTEAELKDDKVYLTDLTELCQHRARVWDQRSSLRADELKAIIEAISILKGGTDAVGAQALDTEVNKRALLQKVASAMVRGGAGAGTAASSTASAGAVPSFLQTGQQGRRASKRGLITLHSSAPKPDAKRQRVLELLTRESSRLGSVALASAAARLTADPFAKVKNLIQDLLERLLREANSEVTRKSFCDEAIGKANQTRDYKWTEANALNRELAQLETKERQLNVSIEELGRSIVQLTTELNETRTERAQDKAANLDTIAKAKQGFELVEKAIAVLTNFYKGEYKAGGADSATVSLAQVQQERRGRILAVKRVRASPVDEDSTGPGFATAYQGKQTAFKGVLGLLQVIRADFDRTATETEKAEKQAAADFVLFDRAQTAEITGKETKQKLEQEELEITQATIVTKMGDLQTAMDLLNDALKMLDELHPVCVANQMTYEERVELRKKEMVALKSALCILGDPTSC